MPIQNVAVSDSETRGGLVDEHKAADSKSAVQQIDTNHAVARLNEWLAVDEAWVRELCFTRHPSLSRELVSASSVQFAEDGKAGFLGELNGLFGVPVICAVVDERTGGIVSFRALTHAEQVRMCPTEKQEAIDAKGNN